MRLDACVLTYTSRVSADSYAIQRRKQTQYSRSQSDVPMLSKTTLSLFLYRCSAIPRDFPSSPGETFAMAPPQLSFVESSPTTTSVGVLGFAAGSANLSFVIFLGSSFRAPATTAPSGLADCPIVRALGEFALFELGLLIGMMSLVCSRETEICRAIEISAAVLSFFSRSSSLSLFPVSSWLLSRGDTGLELRAAVCCRSGIDVVVRFLKRLVGGGECIGELCLVDELREVACGGVPEAVIETEYPRVLDGCEGSTPTAERGADDSRGDVMIWRVGSFGFPLASDASVLWLSVLCLVTDASESWRCFSCGGVGAIRCGLAGIVLGVLTLSFAGNLIWLEIWSLSFGLGETCCGGGASCVP